MATPPPPPLTLSLPLLSVLPPLQTNIVHLPTTSPSLQQPQMPLTLPPPPSLFRPLPSLPPPTHPAADTCTTHLRAPLCPITCHSRNSTITFGPLGALKNKRERAPFSTYPCLM